MPHPVVDPDLRVAVLDDGLVAWLPSQAAALPLSADEFAALTSMWTEGGPSHALAPAVERLRRVGAIIDGDAHAAAARLPQPQPLPDAMDEAGAAGAGSPARLTRPPGACLQPGPRGWCVWSAPLGAHVALGPALARMWLDLGSGLTAEAVAARLALATAADCSDMADGAACLRRLLGAGLLVGKGEAGPGAMPAAAAAPVHLQAGDAWQGLRPDGRRPIYFVTHHVDHLPLALGMLRAMILSHKDGVLLTHYQPLPIVSMSVSELQAVYARFGPGIWLFSDYVWSAEYNLQLSRLVKSVDRRNLTVHGGPSAPKYEDACRDFMQAHPHVDVVVRGAGEQTLVDALEALAGDPGPATLARLADVPGLSFFADGPARRQLVRTPDRPRPADLSCMPSPYLTGMFDHYGGQVVAAVLETNRGCPYSCTFCDWGSATQEKIHRFDLDRVKAEVDWIASHRIRVLWIADANYGIFERDVEIARHIADARVRHGFPLEVVVNYPKNATEKIARIVEIFVRAGISSQGIVSIQTTDTATLRVIRRDNIQTKRYDELGRIFRRQGLPLSTDLMIGLPGATVASFKADLQYYFDDDVGVKAYRTELLPNSPMADPDYMREHRIRVDDANFLISTASYTAADLKEMMAIWSAFDIADGYALMRYVLRYLQWDHGRPALEVLHAMVRTVGDEPAAYPALTWLLRHFPARRHALGGWGPLYREIGRFAHERLGVPAHDPTLAAVLRLNELLMPWPGRRFPEVHSLPFDVEAYYAHNLAAGDAPRLRLCDLAPGTLTVTDPVGIGELDLEALEQYDNHQVFYDLPGRIARRRSAPNFVRKAA